MKPPNHETPSGDRLMARLLVQCLGLAGHRVTIASQFRSFLRDPDDRGMANSILEHAESERARLSSVWQADGPPDLWFCYHPYYKAPDLIGLSLCAEFGVPYVTVEASYSNRRNVGTWSAFQSEVLAGIQLAAVNICMTARDHEGLVQSAPDARFARMKPFIDTGIFEADQLDPVPAKLITVAMMRPGDKFESFTRLATALDLVRDVPWHLSIVGDGALNSEVRNLFSVFPKEQITWHGQKNRIEIAKLLGQSAIYVWPGCGEAYGLAYLEAQAAGLPVVAYHTDGVPEVVADRQSGILTPAFDDLAYGEAISSLLTCDSERIKMSIQARKRVNEYHSLQAAVNTLDSILHQFVSVKP